MGYSKEKSHELLELVRLLVVIQCWYSRFDKLPVKTIAEQWFSQPAVQKYLNINEYDQKLWFNNERLIEFEWWIVTIASIQGSSDPQNRATKILENTLGAFEVSQQIKEARLSSDYQVEKLLKKLSLA